MRINSVGARPITDSRGKETLEVMLRAGALIATASVPSGKSTGSHEVCELRDHDGSVQPAIANVTNGIAHAIIEKEFGSADELDTLLIQLDGTPDKSRLGGNAILAVSIAAQRLFAQRENTPLWKAIARRAGTRAAAPRLFANVLNGGVHADFRLPFQEYMLVAEGITSEALPRIRDCFAQLGTRLSGAPMGDEGGYSPIFQNLHEPFALLTDCIRERDGLSIAIDAAASELYHDGSYSLLGTSYTSADLLSAYGELLDSFSLHSIEDPFAEDAHADFASFTSRFGERTLIVGDDLTTTNPERIRASIAHKEMNAVLIKPNQIGTVKEAIEAVQLTRAAGMQPICSHRSGETMDTFIADFAYGVGAHGIKAGGLGQKERLEKYQRLLAIEREASRE